MSDCDEVLTAVLLGAPLDAAAKAHLATCARCTAEEASVREVSRTLAASSAPVPVPGLFERTLDAVKPVLAENARRAARTALVRALAAALIPLPVVLFADALLVRWVYGFLADLLPSPLGFYVVFNYAATLTVLLTITYAAIPILADRQTRLRLEESHA